MLQITYLQLFKKKNQKKTFRLHNNTDVSLVAIPCKGVTKSLDSTEEKK